MIMIMIIIITRIMVIVIVIMHNRGMEVSVESSLRFDAAAAKNRPVSKVITLLKDMLKQSLLLLLLSLLLVLLFINNSIAQC